MPQPKTCRSYSKGFACPEGRSTGALAAKGWGSTEMVQESTLCTWPVTTVGERVYVCMCVCVLCVVTKRVPVRL